MSVILSSTKPDILVAIVSCLFSVNYTKYDALQIRRFRHIQQNWVVLRLAALLQNSNVAACVSRRRAQHPQEFCLADVERTGAGNEDAAGPEHFQGAQVELLIAAKRGRNGALGFRKGGWVEDDGVILPAGGGVVPEQIEGVGFDPFDLAAAVRGAIELLILLGNLQCRARRIHAGHLLAEARQMQRETPVIGEAVERLTVR